MSENTKAKNEIEELKEELAKAQDEIKGLNAELADIKKREHRAPEVNQTSSDDEYPYTSLCTVYTDTEGKRRLRRIADVYGLTILENFSDSFPEYSNLFTKYGPREEDYLGVWNWSIEPNRNNPSKDHIESIYNADLLPVEIIIVPDCADIDELLSKLKGGIPGKILSDRIMYSCFDFKKNLYIGILCCHNELSEEKGTVKIKDNVLTLPVYLFSQEELLDFRDNRMVLKEFNPGISEQLVNVKEKFEIVKEKVLTRASRTNLKTQGFKIKDYKAVKAFIDSLPTEDIAKEIEGELGCSHEEAQGIMVDFTDHIEEYFNGEDFEDEVLIYILEKSPDLMTRCKSLISEDWKNENAAMLEEANSNLDDIKKQFASKEEELQDIDKKCVSDNTRLSQLDKDIEERKKLAADVEKQVAERINKAREDAAAFIAEQAFCQAVPCSVSNPNEGSWIEGRLLYEEELEFYTDWKSVIDQLQDALSDAGVKDDCLYSFAAFLYSASINKTPLLLIGPNGEAIANAFSACMTGRSCGILNCEGDFSAAVVSEASKSEDSIILIENPFAADWNRHINRLVQESEKYFIAVCPYAEDLLIEPQGILNYWLPVMTELIVDRRPQNDYSVFAGKKADDFEEYVRPKGLHRRHEKLLNSLKMSQLSKTSVQQVLADMHAITEDMSDDDDLLFALYPCAYISGNLDNLSDRLKDMKLSSETQNILEPYLGEEE